MILDFHDIPSACQHQFKGGDGNYEVRTFEDAHNKIMQGTLQQGCSIGLHTHEGTSEIIYVLSGQGEILYDGKSESVKTGQIHYCPEGHTHTLRNNEANPLTFIAIVPQHA